MFVSSMLSAKFISFPYLEKYDVFGLILPWIISWECRKWSPHH